MMKIRMFRKAALALAALGALWAHGALKLDGDFNRQVISVGLKASIPGLRVVDDGGTPLDPSAYTVVYSGNDAYGQATVTVTVNEGADAGTVLTKTFDVVPVPAAYLPLKWVELDGRQGIVTSILPDNEMDIDVRVGHIDNTKGSNGGQPICLQKWNWGDGFMVVFNGAAPGGTVRNRFYVNHENYCTYQGTYAPGVDYHLKLDHVALKFTLDDSTGFHGQTDWTPGADPNGNKLQLFYRKETAGIYCFAGRVYHFTLSKNGSPLLDLVPVRRLSDGKVGMFDAAHPDADDSFYASDYADFIAGLPGDCLTVMPIEDQPFTGSALTPAVTVVRQNGEWITPLDQANFDISYANNIALGTASVTISGKGDYSAFTSAGFFQIVPPADETRITLDGDFGTKFISVGVPAKIDDLTVLGADGQPLAAGTFEVGYMNNDTKGLATVWARITTGEDAGAVNCQPFEVKLLPAGYIPIAWIESTGTQWINTGVTSSMTLETECVITPNEMTCAKSKTSTPIQHAIFGSGWSGWDYGLLTSDAKWRPTAGGKYTDSVSDITLDKRTRLVYTIEGVYVDDEHVSLSALSGYNAAYTRYGKVMIFDTPTETTQTPEYRGQYKLHSFKMTDGGVVLRDFVPVLNADLTPGLFDVAHLEDGDLAFYANGNKTGDDFRAGPMAIAATFSVPEIPAQTLVCGNPTPIAQIIDSETGMPLDLNNFDITYKNNDRPGMASYSVRGKSGTPYAGQVVVGNFNIKNVFAVSSYSVEVEGTGYTWDSPMSFTNAIAASAKTAEAEIWIKSGTCVIPETKSFAISKPLVIRGGFAGTEKTPSERAAGVWTTFDGDAGSTTNDCLTVGNKVCLTIDRLRLVHGRTRGLTKSGVGDFVAMNCEFVNCRLRSDNTSGYAMALSGTDATVTLTNCLIAGCVDLGDTTAYGTVVVNSGMRRIYMDDCRFITNGCPFNATVRYPDKIRGAVMWAESPVTLRNCEFRCNKGFDGNNGCGLIYLYYGSGGSAFTNCLFVGNNGLKSKGAYKDHPNVARGCLVVLQNPGDRTEVVNCTFAYNLIAGLVDGVSGKTGAAGINVVKGDTVVKNCIFYGNAVHTTFPETQTIDMTCHRASPEATLTVSYTLAHDLYPGEGNMTGDPRFVSTANDFFKLVDTENPTLPRMDMPVNDYFRFKPEKLAEVLALDVHVRSTGGYFKNDGVLYHDAARRSRAVDAGDPSDDYCKEGKPNGRRINLGAYGNTPEAARSACGLAIILR